jgi:hypothetical protein
LSSFEESALFSICLKSCTLAAYEMSNSMEDSMSLPLSDLRNVDRPGVTQTVAEGMMPDVDFFCVLFF